MELSRDFYVGVVEDNKDPNRKGRIKIRTQTLYHNMTVSDIPYAYPFAGLAGKEFQVPAVGKLVNVLFLSDDLYSPYYIYSENYNINLQNKLNSLSDDEYANFSALLFDERTNIFATSDELTIDHLYNKITINNNSINLELKDNTQILNLGSKNSDQEAVLGTNFFEWMDRFINELKGPSMVDGLGAPIMKTNIDILCKEYSLLRKNFLSKNVRLNDNDNVDKLQRDPTTVFQKNDIDLVLPPEENPEYEKGLQDAINAQNDAACKQGKGAAPTSVVKIDTDMQLPLLGVRISCRFGLRHNPTNPSEIQGHSAIDIAAPTGTQIKSPEDGTVISSGFDSVYGGGNFIRIKHTNNFTTGYAHLNTILVKTSQNVKRGDIIGLVGNTGGHTTGPHLHFTVTTPDNVKVDPELYFTWPVRPNDAKSTNDQLSKNYQGQDYKDKTVINNCDGETDSQNDSNEDGSPLSGDFNNPNFVDVTKKVIEKLEGGYFHPDMLLDGRIKDKRYKGSGETMFGIDRRTGGKINSSPAGKKFWKLIDNADARNKWSWNYFGGSLKNTLTPLVAEMMKPQYDNYVNKYLTKKAADIVNNDNKLLFNFIYATWNGPGWFQKFAKPINDAVQSGIVDVKKLRRIALDSRKNDNNSLIAQGGNKIENIFNSNFA